MAGEQIGNVLSKKRRMAALWVRELKEKNGTLIWEVVCRPLSDKRVNSGREADNRGWSSCMA